MGNKNLKDFQHLRLEPLNQLAEIKLKTIGLSCSPGILPVFRLMEWGLASGFVKKAAAIGNKLLQLRHMPDQRAALDYLLKDQPEGIGELQRLLLKMSPEEAARKLLKLLELRLQSETIDTDPHPLQ
jgi:hypothetical protein